MPCFLALYEVKGVQGSVGVVDDLSNTAHERMAANNEDNIFHNRSFGFVLCKHRVYLRVLLAPDESRSFGNTLAKFLGLPPVEFINDMKVYKAVDQMISDNSELN